MDAVLKELDKLQRLASDAPSAGKSKTPSIQDSLDSLLQSLHALKRRVEAGVATEAELAALAKTVEARKKDIDERQKEVYNSLARYGKALDKRFTASLPTYDPLFASAEAQDALEHVIAMHFLRTGRFSTAEIFIQEFGVDVPATLQSQFVDLHRILVALRSHDIGPALEWAERNRDFLRSRTSSLEFYLHRSEYLRLLFTHDPPQQAKAIQYASRYIRPFYSTHAAEFKRLMACLIFVPKERMQASPYEDLTSDSIHLDLENMFATEFSASLGMSKQPPLRVVGDIGGGGALARIEKGRKIMRERKSEWSQTDELPIEVPLPPENRYHSIFACPVSKDQSTEQNPPMMMTCGHVVSKDSLQKLSKSQSYASTLVHRSAVSDVSRSSAFSAPELTRLTPAEVEFLDAVISRAPPSATTFIHIFKAYNDVLSERGLDAESEVDYYKKLLKIGTLKGDNWASKWRAVKVQNGYADTSATTRAAPAPTAKKNTSLLPKTPLPQVKVAATASSSTSSTARLLQRLKTLQHEPAKRAPEPSESAADDDHLSQTELTETETEPPPRAVPARTRGRSSTELTETNNSLGLDIGPTTTYAPSSTAAPSRSMFTRWPERDPEIDKSVPFLTSTPPISPYKPAARAVPPPTPTPAKPQIARATPWSSTPRRPQADLRAPPRQAEADEDDAWNKIRMAQDEKIADRLYNERLLERCLEVWKQGSQWITVTTAQVAQARDTFVLRLAIHKWRAALARTRELAAHADARAAAARKATALGYWHARLHGRRQAAWRADMRARMHTLRARRDAALRKDAWARWRQLYQSRLVQQRGAARALGRCFAAWRARLAEVRALGAHAEERARERDGVAVVQCWDAWRRAAELRGLERALAEKVHGRVLREAVEVWRQRTREQQKADALRDAALKQSILNHWKGALLRVRTLERRAEKHVARQEDVLVRAVVRVWKAHERGRLLERVQNTRLVRQAWEAWRKRLRHHKNLEATAVSFAQRTQSHSAAAAVRAWQKRLAKQQGAQTFAVQYANAQLQYRCLFRWRVRLRTELKLFRQAKVAEKYFVVRRMWRVWKNKAEERTRERRLREWERVRAAKVFAEWKEKALRARRLRIAEQEVQKRIGERVLKDALGHWTNRVIAVKLRELEVVQQRDKTIVLSAFIKWKKVCIRHAEELSLMESYQEVKREENMRRMFSKWLAATRRVRHRRMILHEKENEMQRIQLENAWDKWRGRFEAERLLPLERTFILQSQHATMYRAFAIWRSRTKSLPAVRAKYWQIWRDAMPRALQAKEAREMDKNKVLTGSSCRTTALALRAVARARQMRLPTSFNALAPRTNPPPRPAPAGCSAAPRARPRPSAPPPTRMPSAPRAHPAHRPTRARASPTSPRAGTSTSTRRRPSRARASPPGAPATPPRRVRRAPRAALRARPRPPPLVRARASGRS
ncbi:hypothetical protein BC834DRAFT_921486 [Gloeopeniophorella convolvens]|nr:hypothetical protein BC834DRAFT_921486 [Gloeopeniophorella convolvens]